MMHLAITKDTLGFSNFPKVRITCKILSSSFPTFLPTSFPSCHLPFIPFFPPSVHSTYIYGISNLKQPTLHK